MALFAVFRGDRVPDLITRIPRVSQKYLNRSKWMGHPKNPKKTFQCNQNFIFCKRLRLYVGGTLLPFCQRYWPLIDLELTHLRLVRGWIPVKLNDTRSFNLNIQFHSLALNILPFDFHLSVCIVFRHTKYTSPYSLYKLFKTLYRKNEITLQFSNLAFNILNSFFFNSRNVRSSKAKTRQRWFEIEKTF